jgi:endonuclease/exonuclease/phosphatase family metal-dependent hydrolase
MVAAIRDQDLDVLGVQEASIGAVPGGGPQYLDLLKRIGSPYKLTEYGRKSSPDVRIIYNSQRVKLLRQGTIALPKGNSARYLNWAVLEQRSSGKKFLFANTHLEPKDGRKYWNTRNRQTSALISAVKKRAGNLPVIVVGDFASTKWDDPSNKPYDLMQAAGYKDPLGNAARSHGSTSGAFVEKRIHTSFSSLNMYKRTGRNFAPDINGSNTDYIFVTPMRVAEYEVVVKVDSAGRLVGVIPSDHNMLRATVYLP